MVDYNKDKFGGQLTIKAPNAKMPGSMRTARSRIESITCSTTR